MDVAVTCVQCKEGLPAGARICPRCRALQPVAGQAGAIGPGATVDLGYGRIVVQARLGAGGMGVVWRGWLFFAPTGPRGTDEPLALALKVLQPRSGDQSMLRALFANEAEALKSVQHPNIVRFHDFFEWGGSLVLAMELVDGSTLEDLISRHRARARLRGPGEPLGVPVPRAWYYFQQLLGALAATHAMNVVHRDIKPSNVLIRRDGIVKLSDYGIARLTSPPAGTPRATSATAVGTGAYMPPEQVLSRPVDARSDLYSAGIVFYELLAGRPPFSPDDLSEFSLRQAQVEAPPPPLGMFAPHVPAAVEPLLARALAKDPQYRFASVLEMGEAIRIALGERDTPEWRAQAEIASKAPIPDDASLRPQRDSKLRTLREFVISGYKAANPTR